MQEKAEQNKLSEKEFIYGLCDAIRDYFVCIVRAEENHLTVSFVGGQKFCVIAKEVA